MSHDDGLTTQQSEAFDENGSSSSQSKMKQLLASLSGGSFEEWHRERQYRHNIENGTPYFNGPSSVPEPERHSPSRLLKCHRQVSYQQCNAPEETSDPDGIFWIGSQFEEELVFPFLERAITGTETYVQNSVWIDFRVERKGVELRIKGETDPLIVDHEAVPILPTEIKTKSTVENTTSPNRSHRAQLHAYMVGLSKKYDIDLRDGVILYGSRDTLDVKVFHVEFDQTFWEEVVLEWASNHTQYRLKNKLPPAEPEYDWECKFCSYRERCGQGESEYRDFGPLGLLPGHDYPREKVAEYLEAHGSESLTPKLAEEYPELAEQYGVISWWCRKCDSSFAWETVDRTNKSDSKPLCPKCAEENRLTELRFRSVEERRTAPKGGTYDPEGSR